MNLKTISPLTEQDIKQYIDRKDIEKYYSNRNKERNKIYLSMFFVTLTVFLMGLFRPSENNITYSEQPELTLIQSILGILFFIGLLLTSFFIGRYSNVK